MFPIDRSVGRSKVEVVDNDKQPGKHKKVPCFKQLWLVLSVKLMEINSNLFSREVLIGLSPF